jgi:hypothetical protein
MGTTFDISNGEIIFDLDPRLKVIGSSQISNLI